jgi:hypothetical protein
MRLPASEFLRRFLLHVLPKGFTKVRHYGILANRSDRLKRCRDLLASQREVKRTDEPSIPIEEPPPRCSSCGSTALVRREIPSQPQMRRVATSEGIDSS